MPLCRAVLILSEPSGANSPCFKVDTTSHTFDNATIRERRAVAPGDVARVNGVNALALFAFLPSWAEVAARAAVGRVDLSVNALAVATYLPGAAANGALVTHLGLWATSAVDAGTSVLTPCGINAPLPGRGVSVKTQRAQVPKGPTG